ncbi:MAG: pitrilysin family protein [Alphaproteobacteria bacterium]|nr:pitrilysin family protein [Alphaproteobacteria bacterium]
MLNQFNAQVNRSEAPQYTDLTKFNFDLKPYIHFKLQNNCNLYIIEGGSQEILDAKFVFDAGTFNFSNINIPKTTNTLLLSGTNQWSSKQIHEQFEQEGIFINLTCGKKTATIHIQCLSKNFAKALPLLTDILSDCVFPEDEIKTFTTIQKHQIIEQLKRSDVQADKIIKEYIYGTDHPYSRFAMPELFDNVNQVDIMDCYQQFYCFGKCNIFISGKGLEHLELVDLLDNHIGKLPFTNQDVQYIKPVLKELSTVKETIYHNPKAVQGSIRLGRPIVNMFHEDFFKLRILNILFGGYFGSRLIRSIRETKGYTYSIYSQILFNIDYPSFIINTEVSKPNIMPCLNEIKRQMDILHTELVSDDELKLVKNFIFGTFLNELDGIINLATIWQTYILNSIPVEYFYRSIHTVKTITPEDIQKVAQKYLNYQEFYELTVI